MLPPAPILLFDAIFHASCCSTIKAVQLLALQTNNKGQRGDANPGYFVSSFMLSCSCQCLNSFKICMGFCTKNIGFSCRSSVRSIGFLELQLALSCFQASDGAIPTRLATNFSLSSAALLSWHGGISLHLWTSSNPYTQEFVFFPSCATPISPGAKLSLEANERLSKYL